MSPFYRRLNDTETTEGLHDPRLKPRQKRHTVLTRHTFGRGDGCQMGAGRETGVGESGSGRFPLVRVSKNGRERQRNSGKKGVR